MFNFTLIGNRVLERGVKSSFENRLEQLAQLVKLFGASAIKLRFDPIVIYTDQKTGKRCDNLENYEIVIRTASELGIKRVIFAFCIDYPKVTHRMLTQGKILEKMSIDDQQHILDPLIDIAEHYGVQLETCCGSQLIGYRSIGASKCIDGEVISQLLGHSLRNKRKDQGQRKECNCCVSRDIGSYHMKCQHSCTYCYANPSK
jgi:DNA repair photolyase